MDLRELTIEYWRRAEKCGVCGGRWRRLAMVGIFGERLCMRCWGWARRILEG